MYVYNIDSIVLYVLCIIDCLFSSWYVIRKSAGSHQESEIRKSSGAASLNLCFLDLKVKN